jgi:hypothetical protein
VNALARASLIYLVLTVVHAADHARQGRDLATEVSTVGLLGLFTSVVLLVLALRRHEQAPTLAVLLGGGAFLGFAAVHLLPHWSAFSDPYADFDLDALSWVLVVLPMLSAAYLLAVGLRFGPRRPATSAP